jgi:ABC-type phosphonate transport system ATPase subunit
MLSRTISAAVAFAAAVAVSVAVRRYRSLHRVLQRERAAARLMDGCLHRDLAAFRSRVDAAAARLEAERAVVLEACRTVDQALAVHGAQLSDPNDPYDPLEGGPS